MQRKMGGDFDEAYSWHASHAIRPGAHISFRGGTSMLDDTRFDNRLVHIARDYNIRDNGGSEFHAMQQLSIFWHFEEVA